MFQIFLDIGIVGLVGVTISVSTPNSGNWMWATECLGLTGIVSISPIMLF